MSVEVECAACFNRGSGAGWVARSTDGVVHWLCPACVAANSQPIPVVTADDLARLTQSQAQRAIAICPECGAASPAGKCPLCQLRREGGRRFTSSMALSLIIVITAHLAFGVLAGLVQSDLPRALAAALGGGLPAALTAALAVTSYLLHREGQRGFLISAGRRLHLAAVVCVLLGCAAPFFPYASASRPHLLIAGQTALYVLATGTLAAVIQWLIFAATTRPAARARHKSADALRPTSD